MCCACTAALQGGYQKQKVNASRDFLQQSLPHVQKSFESYAKNMFCSHPHQVFKWLGTLGGWVARCCKYVGFKNPSKNIFKTRSEPFRNQVLEPPGLTNPSRTRVLEPSGLSNPSRTRVLEGFKGPDGSRTRVLEGFPGRIGRNTTAH